MVYYKRKPTREEKVPFGFLKSLTLIPLKIQTEKAVHSDRLFRYFFSDKPIKYEYMTKYR